MDIKEYLEKFGSNEGKKFTQNKVSFAKSIQSFLNKDDLDNVLDLKKKVLKVITNIEKWNA